MQTLVVMNGEDDWQRYLPGITIEQRRIQSCKWLWHQQQLWVVDATGPLRVDALLWRVGAIRPQPHHRAALEMVRLAGIPCVNPAATLLRGYDRLGMLHELASIGLPVLDFSVALGDGMLEMLQPELPAVLKVGNLHGGLGKARPMDADAWADARDLAFASDDYATVEPYVDYARDIRCLVVGDDCWAMVREGTLWKVNVQTASHEIITPPPILEAYTRRAQAHLGADVLALDFLETRDGRYIVLESNDIPGFSGFPDAVQQAVARIMRAKMESQ